MNHSSCCVCLNNAVVQCGMCNTLYCSQNCSNFHWETHKFECFGLGIKRERSNEYPIEASPPLFLIGPRSFLALLDIHLQKGEDLIKKNITLFGEAHLPIPDCKETKDNRNIGDFLTLLANTFVRLDKKLDIFVETQRTFNRIFYNDPEILDLIKNADNLAKLEVRFHNFFHGEHYDNFDLIHFHAIDYRGFMFFQEKFEENFSEEFLESVIVSDFEWDAGLKTFGPIAFLVNGLQLFIKYSTNSVFISFLKEALEICYPENTNYLQIFVIYCFQKDIDVFLKKMLLPSKEKEHEFRIRLKEAILKTESYELFDLLLNFINHVTVLKKCISGNHPSVKKLPNGSLVSRSMYQIYKTKDTWILNANGNSVTVFEALSDYVRLENLFLSYQGWRKIFNPRTTKSSYAIFIETMVKEEINYMDIPAVARFFSSNVEESILYCGDAHARNWFKIIQGMNIVVPKIYGETKKFGQCLHTPEHLKKMMEDAVTTDTERSLKK